METPIKKKRGRPTKVSKLVVPDNKNDNNCDCRLTMHFNNETFDCFTNNLKISFLSFKPTQVFTEGYIKIQKGQGVFERKVTLVKLRQLFNDEMTLDIFLDNVMIA